MKNYEFVTVLPKGVSSNRLTEHRKIIKEYADKGYRFVTALPIESNLHGVPTKFDFVFEIESD